MQLLGAIFYEHFRTKPEKKAKRNLTVKQILLFEFLSVSKFKVSVDLKRFLCSLAFA